MTAAHRSDAPKATTKAGPVVAAIAVSDLNSLAVFGLEPHRFRKLVRLWGVSHIQQGQRILVLVSDFLEAMRARTERREDGAHDAAELAARLHRMGVRRAR